MAEEFTGRHSREEVLQTILHRLHRRWRLVVGIPLVYILCGMALAHFYFVPSRNGDGFFPLSDLTVVVWLFAGGGLVGVLWALLGRLQARQVRLLIPHRHDPAEFYRRARDHQLAQFMVCDLVALPGIILFLLDGNLVLLFAFCITSSLFYLRSLPSGYRLGLAMFHGETAMP